MPNSDVEERRACQKRHYRRHPGYYRERNRRVRARNRGRLNKLKEKPCVDCGGRFHPVAMEFDHVVTGKKLCVSEMMVNSWAMIEKEMALCELVCSNCHHVRTWRRQQVRVSPT